jgi:hypothetical protein
VEIEEGGLEEYVGAGPVNATMFKLKLKMYRWCTFYTSACPGWLKALNLGASYPW